MGRAAKGQGQVGQGMVRRGLIVWVRLGGDGSVEDG